MFSHDKLDLLFYLKVPGKIYMKHDTRGLNSTIINDFNYNNFCVYCLCIMYELK